MVNDLPALRREEETLPQVRPFILSFDLGFVLKCSGQIPWRTLALIFGGKTLQRQLNLLITSLVGTLTLDFFNWDPGST